MDEPVIDKKYTDFIENLIEQVTPLLPQDVNELQKSYLITNIRKSATLMATSIQENEDFSRLDFDNQCFYIQVIAECLFTRKSTCFVQGFLQDTGKALCKKSGMRCGKLCMPV